MDFQKIASRVAQWEDQLHGGLADDKEPQDFDTISLVKGLVVELEHVNKDAHELLKGNMDAVFKAMEIAMDHLSEDAQYYDKLAEMEGESGSASQSEPAEPQLGP